MERITQEIVKYQDDEKERIFVVKKMNPLLGIAVLKEILFGALPVDLFSDVEGMGQVTSMFSNVQKKEMSIDEFVKLERRLLSNVSEKLKSGEVPVIDSAGNYRVSNLENNMFLNGYLMVKVVEVNYKDFFLELFQKFKTFGETKKEILEAMNQNTEI